MQCDVCGRAEADYIVSLEGAKVSACARCSKHGKMLYKLKEDEPDQPVASPRQRAEEEIVENYAKLIRSAREKADLTRLQLGQKIGEKENYLEAIEQGRVRPTLVTAKKLEKELSITLIEREVLSGVVDTSTSGSKELTLGDVLSTQKKRA